MTDLALILFGAPRIELDGVPLHVERQKALALLTFLAVTRLPHRRDKLAALLWPDLNQEHARAALRRTLSALRAALPRPVLATADANVAIDLQADLYVDVVDFRRLIAEAQSAQDVHKIHILETAIQLYQDDFLSGFSLSDSPEFEEWHRTQSHHVKQELDSALADLADAYAAQHDHTSAVRYALRRVDLDPLDEAAQQRLISLYVESGDVQAGQRQYAHYSRIVEDELGVRLPHSVADCWPVLAVRQRDAIADVAVKSAGPPVQGSLDSAVADMDAQPSKSEDRATQMLGPELRIPVNAPPLIGREDELCLLKRLWAETVAGKSHCVVLVGEAGIGKTRLAEEVMGWIRHSGEAVAAAHCYAAEGALAYSPVVTWLRADAAQWTVDTLDPMLVSEVARLLPELQTGHPESPLPAPITEGWQRRRFFEALARAFLARKRPLLLFLDDLQWCDVDTLAWLRFLLHWSRPRRCCCSRRGAAKRCSKTVRSATSSMRLMHPTSSPRSSWRG